MGGFIEHMIEAQNQSRAYPDEEKSAEEILIIELEEILEWFDEPGYNIHDIKQLLQEKIEQLKLQT